MKFEAKTHISGTKEAVWQVITNIDESVKNIGAIQEIEVLERPPSGIVGLKWRETRTMFGREATEVMWITDSKENDYYQTRAESHGAIYVSKLQIVQSGDGVDLTMSFDGQAQTFMAKIMSVIPGILFKSATEKALLQDLEDIKSTVENAA